MVDTWPNLRTIQKAIESEVRYLRTQLLHPVNISLAQAAEILVSAAGEFTPVQAEYYNFQAATLLRKSNIVNRFWFEDGLWRYKESYNRIVVSLQREVAA